MLFILAETGCPVVFIETTEAPERAPSEAPNMVPLRSFWRLMRR